MDSADEAPPSYDDVISSTRYPVLRSQSQSDAEGGAPPWKLRFVDFTPHLNSSSSRRAPEDFGKLVDKANTWLQSNKDVTVISCETVTWSATSRSQLNDTNEVRRVLKAKTNKMYFMRALRLWLVPKPEDGEHVTIGMRDFEPDVTLEDQSDVNKFLKFINNRIQEDPIPGGIIGIETVIRRLIPNVRAKDSYWTESGNCNRQHAFFFRIFFIRGRPFREQIGVKDFCPERSRDNGGKLEDFDDVVQRGNVWVRNEPGVRVVNVQAVWLKRKDSSKKAQTDKLLYTIHSSRPTYFHQVYRVAYTKLRNSVIVRVEEPLMIVKKTFVPSQKSTSYSNSRDDVKFESFSKTVEQVSTWMHATGAEVLSVETMPVKLVMGRHDQNTSPETTVYCNSVSGKDETWFTHLRIYVQGSSLQRASVSSLHSGGNRFLDLPYQYRRATRQTSGRSNILRPKHRCRNNILCTLGIVLAFGLFGGIATLLVMAIPE